MTIKMMSPNTTLWWFDFGAITTPASPKITEITAALASAVPGAMGMNLSAAVVAGYTLNPTDSDTDNTQAIIDTGAAQSRAAANYEGNLTFFRERSPLTNTSSEYLKAYQLFRAKGRSGWLVRRVGKIYTAAPTVGDNVEVYQFITDQPRSTAPSTSGGPTQFTVPFLKQGTLYVNVPLQA